jgi:hypothetical protein
MTTSRTYPARLDGELDPQLSRWLWLVKWLLVLPHVFVLVFLWIAFVVLSIVAWFAILFTGRYPRAIFDFNVGVLRWTWRVSFYAYDALGTDRYPPFSLKPDPSYPAHFDIDYPQRLSRGLVLVKSWLLAIPQYVVIGLFAGGAGWHVGGLITVLAIIAAVILLFSGAYPREIFEFVMGMNRWCFRVVAYAALMTDEYPPFRLDNGGADPGSAPAVVTPAPDPAPATAQ